MKTEHKREIEPQPAVKSEPWLAIVGTALLVLALLLTRAYDYLVFHTAVEVFTVAVSFSTFFLAWNARRFLDNHYLLLVGIASLFIGGTDTLHALAYKGMHVFQPDGANIPTQLWIAGRYMTAASLLLAPLFVRRKLHAGVTAAIYGVLTALLIASIFSGVFPACYIEGVGLTPFKLRSEHVITVMLLAAGVLLYRRRREFDIAVWSQLAASIAMTAGAEVAFTAYVGVYDEANVAGHLLRFVAACLMYRAIIVTGLVRPYNLLFRNLAMSEEALRKSDERYRGFVARTSEGIVRLETEQPIPVPLPPEEQVQLLLQHAYVAECNDVYAKMHGGANAAEFIGARPPDTELLNALVRSGYNMTEPVAWEVGDGPGRRCLEGRFTGVVENGCLVRAWGVQSDITERRLASLERERLIDELQRALAEVKTLTGLLPICANCKKIRDDKGYWTQVESYLEERVNVAFSHSICPECMTNLYPEFYPPGETAVSGEHREQRPDLDL